MTEETAQALAAWRAGDERSFGALVAPYRHELEVHCYRMTSSLSDAEDLLQESLIRAWRHLGGFEGRSSLRTWLYQIATNVCLTELARRPRRALPSELGPAADPAAPPAEPRVEPVWLEPCPDALWQAAPVGPETCLGARQSVALAFLAVIQLLPPLQRAVLILRDVLGFSAAEAAQILATSVAAVNSALQRARATLEARREQLEREAHLDAEDPRTRDLLARYVEAWESGDTDALVHLLRADATLTMPPVPSWFRGATAIGAFLAGLLPRMGELRLQVLPVSGGLGVAAYLRAPGAARFQAQALHALTHAEGRLASLHVFMMPALFARFGLPPEL